MLNKITIKPALVALLIQATDLLARAGGGGGRSSGGGSFSGGGGGFSSSGGSGGSMSPEGMVLFIIIFIIFSIYSSAKAKNAEKKAFLANFPDGDNGGRQKGLAEFKAQNQTFSETTFKHKVKRAFSAIQDAWSNQDLTDVRRFLSDGVWQRFNVQFTMMKELQQKNELSNLDIKNVFIDSVESDGAFDVIHVGIEATLTDKFLCQLDPTLNSGGYEHFVEYWSFIRKRGVEGKDIYSVTNCPGCNAPLGDTLTEVAICPYCSAVVNSGEYDWVLSEITQAEDYTRGIMLQKQQNLHEKQQELVAKYSDFSVQQIEDRVSNGFMQILAAKALKEPARVRRFVSDALYEAKLQDEINDFDMLYNRLYTNDVSLLAASQMDDRQLLYVGVTYSAQRVRKTAKGIVRIDGAVHTMREVVRIERSGSGESSGQLYMHRCSNCGAPVLDTLNVTCQYCQATLNSTDKEWIISDILTPAEYREQIMINEEDFDYTLDTEIMDSLLSVKDYAISNIIAMIACDGKIAEEELKYLRKVAKQLNYSKGQQENILKIAMTGNTSIRMPDDMKQRQKIFTLMEKAAKSDGKIAPQEAKLMEFVQITYLMK